MATQLTPEQMKSFIRRHFDEFVNDRNAEVFRANATPGFLDHDGPGGKEAGVEDEIHMMRGFYERMPELHVTIQDVVAEGDRVVCRNIWEWSDPDSGDTMEFHGFVEWRFEGERLAERWATVTPASRSVRAPSPSSI